MQLANIKKIVIALVGIVLISGCAGSMNATHDPETSDKLKASEILKKGWAELPIPIFASETMPERFKDSLQDALEIWNFEAGIELFEYQGEVPESESTEQTRDGINVVYWDSEPHPSGYFGETFMAWVNSNVMVEADIVFYGDADEFDVLSCSSGHKCTKTVRKKDFLTTALHELGHVLGFEHSDIEGHVMNPNFTYGYVWQEIDEGLIAELHDVYSRMMVAEK